MKNIEKKQLLENTGVIEFRERLLLAQEGMSGNAFAKKVEMSEAVIRDYLSGKTYPSLNRLAIIAKKCDVPIAWLATGQGECRLLPSKGVKSIVNIPIYQPNTEIEHFDELNGTKNQITNLLPFDLNCIKSHDFHIDDLFFYWAKGDSMSPTISDNDTLIFNVANVAPFDGYIYLIKYGDALIIKRIQNHGKYLLLLSDNEKYPSMQIDKLNIENDFKVIGRIICIIKDLS
ncbi:XRE family transcriptional regulator [Orbus sturtevantii]|uniref:LexA family transcriptional regulator n=1 Tax=Orbus sturtevantii TaxID=3074109 RepID=UPI00370D813A